MENFFIEDRFFSDLDDFLDWLDLSFNEMDVKDLEDNWTQKVGLTELQPMFQIDTEFIVDSVMERTDKWDDRWPQDDDKTADQVKTAIRVGIDVEVINKFIPKLYYPTGKFEVITKQDLLKYIK